MGKSAGLSFIFITILLDAIGIGLIFPILPELLRRFVTDGAAVAHFYGLFLSCYATMQFIASPVLGALSDRFGRRPILLFSLVGAGIDYLIMAFAPSLSLLFVGRVISGLTGAGMTVATSYIADISDEKNRAGRFGMIHAAFGLGFIIGPTIGGLVGSYGVQYPFLVAAGMNLLNFLFGVFVLPESLPREKRRQIQLKNLNPFRSIAWAFSIKTLVPFLTVMVFYNLAGQVPPSVWSIYMEHKLGWTPSMIGVSFSVFGLCMAVVQAGLTGKIVGKLGEYRATIFGLALNAFAFVLFASATRTWMVYVAIIPTCLSGVAAPAIQSLVTAEVGPDQQGELQGTLVSLMSLSAALTPLAVTEVFSRFSERGTPYYYPGAPFILGAVLFLVASTIAYRHHATRVRTVNVLT